MDRYPTPVINNTLLTALTRTSRNSTTLVPHLRVLECISNLKFDDSVYLGFLFSRCGLGGSIRVPFVSRVRFPMEYHQRPVDPNVAAQIHDMSAHGVLEFEWLWSS
ncbi:hypothetical protein C8R45DRAFT_1096165 [Mycena sanguinolenta]|nr:hypothetical protein C8R45DRAFT_1096165 [Mycena sanguinolenta]